MFTQYEDVSLAGQLKKLTNVGPVGLADPLAIEHRGVPVPHLIAQRPVELGNHVIERDVVGGHRPGDGHDVLIEIDLLGIRRPMLRGTAVECGDEPHPPEHGGGGAIEAGLRGEHQARPDHDAGALSLGCNDLAHRGERMVEGFSDHPAVVFSYHVQQPLRDMLGQSFCILVELSCVSAA